MVPKKIYRLTLYRKQKINSGIPTKNQKEFWCFSRKFIACPNVKIRHVTTKTCSHSESSRIRFRYEQQNIHIMNIAHILTIQSTDKYNQMQNINLKHLQNKLKINNFRAAEAY